MVQRDPLELVFDSASTLYIAQAGPRIQEPYEVSLLSVSLNLKDFCKGTKWHLE